MSCPPDLQDICRYLDAYLRIAEIADYPNAVNGLQLERTGTVLRVGAAVDACGYTISRAVERGVDLLLVHHGLFWGGLQPVTGGRFRLLRDAFSGGLAIYSAHLPLDVHPEVGNNVRLCRALGLRGVEPFLDRKGTMLGLRGRHESARMDLVARLEAAVSGPVRVCPGGAERVAEIGVITGGAGGEARAVAAAGIDTFVTGEGPHWTHALAEELGLNILYGGHYATETFGVSALAAHLADRFGLTWEFIEHPTGL